jgi:hypothetical protein
MIVLILELTTAFTAVIFPVSGSSHVLIGSGLGGKRTSASFTLELRSPMLQSIHMLITRALAAKTTRAHIAIGPMIVIIHVIIAIALVDVAFVTSGAYVHVGE